ncbi:unnamed protein product, partial [Porites lobata]
FKKLHETLKDAEENLGETEMTDALYAKAEYLCQIGDKEKALTVFRFAYEKAVALGYKLDIIFYQIRIGLFYLDNDLITGNIDKAKTPMEEGGDWDRRNRLKVYQGIYFLSIRDFKSAANNFLDSISAFTSYELMDYKTFVTYTVLASMIALERVDLRQKVVNGAEILEVLHQLPVVNQFLTSLYNCHYADFFVALGTLTLRTSVEKDVQIHCAPKNIHPKGRKGWEQRRLKLHYFAGVTIACILTGKSYGVQIKISNDDDVFSLSTAQVEDFLKQDRLLYPHCRYYIREMRIHAYTQLLESYRSLTLQYMANAFGVSEEFIDKELSRFIAAGRLNCKIDKVGGVVETNRPDHKNWQYQV